jgi:uncharacterized protein YndB with AHSA1/START domain
MAEIRHRVGIDASPANVYEAVATTEGISNWWARELDGDPSQGGKLNFYFGQLQPGLVMEVLDAVPQEKVSWRCVQGPEDWVGTRVDFEIKESDEETVLLFAHDEWREPVEFMSHCSTKWGYYLIGLKSLLEGGVGTPYPDDSSLSKVWN